MPTATTRKKPVKSVARTPATQAVATAGLTGQALLENMEAYRKRVAATPASARGFLTRLGVMTTNGKIKTLIRG